MYANGLGVSQDDKQAVKWFRLAAEQGNADAQNNLGWVYANGLGIPKDLEEAVKWYRLAAEQGHDLARGNLDDMQEVMEKYETIYNACLLDKSSGIDMQIESLRRAVEETCKSMAQDPSWIDRLRYD